MLSCDQPNMTNLFSAFPELPRIALALALGLLVGVQRGWASRNEPSGSRFAGVRTLGLLGLSGGFAGAFASSFAPLSIVLLGASASLIVLGYWNAARHGAPVDGTASIVSLLVLTCGYLSGSGEGVIATAASGLMVLVLALRSQLHGWVASLSEKEIVAIARFALIALVILPLLPNAPFGPYGAWQARQLWLVVVMVSGFSFAGYLAAKYFGARRGVLATAAAGSMVSSTAVTAALAGQLKTGAGDAPLLNAGIALGSAVMFVRVMILCAVLAPVALGTFAMIAAPGLLVSVALFGWQLRRADFAGGEAPTPSRNPFDLGPALLLTVLVMVMLVVARWVLSRYGDSGLALVLAATGTLDVDSAIITMGNLPKGTLGPHLAGLVLAPPVLLNTLFKAGIALTVPGWRKGWPGAAALLAAFAASGGAALAVLLA